MTNLDAKQRADRFRRIHTETHPQRRDVAGEPQARQLFAANPGKRCVLDASDFVPTTLSSNWSEKRR
jgi:hypothetical protein